MDNRSIAAFIETKRTKMNSVIICQKKLLTPSSRDEWQAHGLRVHVTCQNLRGGLNIMATDT